MLAEQSKTVEEQRRNQAAKTAASKQRNEERRLEAECKVQEKREQQQKNDALLREQNAEKQRQLALNIQQKEQERNKLHAVRLKIENEFECFLNQLLKGHEDSAQGLYAEFIRKYNAYIATEKGFMYNPYARSLPK